MNENLREFVIVLNRKEKTIEVIKNTDFINSDPNNYLIIDDSNSEYKAKLKAKEVKCMGVENYLKERLK